MLSLSRRYVFWVYNSTLIWQRCVLPQSEESQTRCLCFWRECIKLCLLKLTLAHLGSYLFEEETDARLSQENFQVLRPGGKAQGTNFVQDEKLLKHFKQQRGKISWRRFSPIELNMKEHKMCSYTLSKNLWLVCVLYLSRLAAECLCLMSRLGNDTN